MRRWLVVSALVWSVVGTIFSSTAANAYDTRGFDYYVEALKKGSRLGGYDNVAEAGPIVTAAQIVNVLLSILGAFAICMVVYAGFLWLTAQGKEEDIKKAKDVLAGSAIGLFVILASYSIMAYIFRSFINVTN